MGNAQSLPKHNFYLTRVTNLDLPLVPFIHTITGFNNTSLRDVEPTRLKEVLRTQDLCLEVLDIVLNRQFQVRIPQGSIADGRIGINVTKLAALPTPLRAQVTAVRESAETPLKVGDRILGIDNVYVENEEELFFEIKSSKQMRLVVLRDDKVEIMEYSGPEMGCEVGTGLIYTVPEKEYKMKGYNGKIVKIWTYGSEAASSSGEPAGQESTLPVQEVNPLFGEPANQEGTMRQDQAVNTLPVQENNPLFGEPAGHEDTLGQDQAVNTLPVQDQEISTASANPLSDELASLSLNNPSGSVGEASISHQPQIPTRPSSSTSGLNVLNRDKTASYAYVSPRVQIPTGQPEIQLSGHVDNQPGSHSADHPIDQVNTARIYEEAGVPPEKIYFEGESVGAPNTASIVGTGAVSNEDLITRDGETRMKDEAYEERRKSGGASIFDEDDDDRLPFDDRSSNHIQAL